MGEIMNQAQFTKDEAQKLLGTRVQTCADLTDVPAGTLGLVNGLQEVNGSGEYRVSVRFDPALTRDPVIKWLSKSDFLSFVKEAPQYE